MVKRKLVLPLTVTRKIGDGLVGFVQIPIEMETDLPDALVYDVIAENREELVTIVRELTGIIFEATTPQVSPDDMV